MKKEIRTKTVEYVVYIAKDGKEFKTQGECKFHEKRLDGLIKDCPECNGKGEIPEEVIEEDYHTGAPYRTNVWHSCPTCNGKGYLEKKIKEVWE